MITCTHNIKLCLWCNKRPFLVYTITCWLSTASIHDCDVICDISTNHAYFFKKTFLVISVMFHVSDSNPWKVSNLFRNWFFSSNVSARHVILAFSRTSTGIQVIMRTLFELLCALQLMLLTTGIRVNDIINAITKIK